MAQPLTSLGGEFSVSGERRGDQMLPAVSMHANGGWVVWQDSLIDRSGAGIAARRLGSDFEGLGSAIGVNNTKSGDQINPAVASLSNGGAVVAWQGGIIPGLSDIYARFLTPAGGIASAELKVSPATAVVQRRYVTNMLAYINNKLITRRFAITEVTKVARDLSGHPVVATLPDGSVVVAYDAIRNTRTNGWRLEERLTQLGGRSYLNSVLRPFSQIGSWGFDVFLRRYSATGQPLGAEVKVNQHSSDHQRYPAITVLANGNFVVAWVSEEMINIRISEILNGSASAFRDRIDIMARVFSPQGQPVGDEFTVNTAANLCGSPSLAPLADGGFLAAWSENTRVKPQSWDVWARSFRADGTTSEDAFRLNTYTDGDQFTPKLVSAGAQQFALWTSLSQDGSWEGVYARLLVDGVPVGGEKRINTSTASRQMQPAVAVDSRQRYLAVWSGVTRTNSFDIFGQALGVSLSLGANDESLNGLAAAAGAGADSSLSAAGTGGTLPLAPSVAAALLREAGRGVRVGIAVNRHARELRWNAAPGGLYQVQISTNLSTWTNLGEPRTAVGAMDSLSLTGEQAVAFFRVIQVR